MKTLMVTPYPPVRDGIAAYAVQAVARLRAAGDEVEVLSPGPSAAHYHLDLCGTRGVLALARRVRRYDRVVVQFHPDMFFPVQSTAGERVSTAAALALTFRLCRDLEVRVHETDYSLGQGPSPAAMAIRAMWHAVPEVVVHSQSERQEFHRAFGVPLDRITATDHGAHFARRTSVDRAAARQRFGIPSDEVMFLSIGFIQPHKGFDRAITAFAGLGRRGCRLDVVGSVRVEEPDYVRHVNELERLVEATPGAHLHLGYVSDEAFDAWIVAADAIVLPYRHIWSSGVLERAGLYDVPVIATRVGGLETQSRPGTVLVDGDTELVRAMWDFADARLRSGPDRAGEGSWPDPGVSAAEVMAAVQARARDARGGRPATLDVGGPAGPGRPGLRPAGSRQASAPLRQLAPLALPAPSSNRFGAGFVKRAVRRLTAWQLDPLVWHLNHLQRAAVEATERLEEKEPGPS